MAYEVRLERGDEAGRLARNEVARRRLTAPLCAAGAVEQLEVLRLVVRVLEPIRTTAGAYVRTEVERLLDRAHVHLGMPGEVVVQRRRARFGRSDDEQVGLDHARAGLASSR